MDADYRGWPHLMCSGFDCDKRALMSFDAVYGFLKKLPDVVGMQRMGLPIVYKVRPEDHPDIGITGTAIIATSHISIHTFPNGQKDGKPKPRWVLCSDFGFSSAEKSTFAGGRGTGWHSSSSRKALPRRVGEVEETWA